MQGLAMSIGQSICVSVASGALGGLLGGAISLFVARINRKTTLEAAEISGRNSIAIAKANNAAALQIGKDNNETTLKAVEVSRIRENEAEYLRRKRDQIEAIGLEFVTLSEAWYEMVAQSLYIAFPKNESQAAAKGVAYARLGKIDTHDVFVGIRKLRSRARVLNRTQLAEKLADFIRIHSDAIAKIMAREEAESLRLQARLMQAGDETIEILYEIHRLEH